MNVTRTRLEYNRDMKWTALILVWVFGLAVLIPSVAMWFAYTLDESITGVENNIDNRLWIIVVVVPIVLVLYTIRIFSDKHRQKKN